MSLWVGGKCRLMIVDLGAFGVEVSPDAKSMIGKCAI